MVHTHTHLAGEGAEDVAANHSGFAETRLPQPCSGGRVKMMELASLMLMATELDMCVACLCLACHM
jgi:hypothetical protein